VVFGARLPREAPALAPAVVAADPGRPIPVKPVASAGSNTCKSCGHVNVERSEFCLNCLGALAA
jgi:hypothetical protein